MASWKLSIEVTYWSSFKLAHESHTFDLKEKESYPVPLEWPTRRSILIALNYSLSTAFIFILVVEMRNSGFKNPEASFIPLYTSLYRFTVNR